MASNSKETGEQKLNIYEKTNSRTDPRADG
jgi:hypothetical protein